MAIYLPFSSFKSNIYEYELNVKNSIKEINLTAISNDLNAKVIYQNKHSLSVGDNIVKIKVQAEDGTVKEYVLKITREKEIPLVNNIEITDILFDFSSDIYDYEINTEKTTLDFNIALNSKKATSNIIDNKNLENGSVVKIKVKDDDKTLTYNFKIINEENKKENIEEDIEENKNNQDLKDKKSFFQEYELIIGLSVFALGVITLLTAILTKPKKSQIM